MQRTLLLKMILGVIILFVPICTQSQGDGKMNVLFIAVDDLKPTLGCYGDTMAITPNIDALASRGILFSAAYCQQAVCAPSRASLLTSRYPDQTGVEDLQTMMREVSPGITSLPEYLSKAGYLTTATGKIFDFRSVDDAMDAPSWSYPYRKHYDAKYYDPVNGKPSYYYASEFSKDTIARLEAEATRLGVDVNSFVREHYFPATESAEVRYDGYVDGAILNAGIELLEEVSAREEPFFLGVGFHRPHLPFVAPKAFWDLYDRSGFSLASFQQKAENSPDIAYHNYEELRSYTGIPESGSLTAAQQLELIHGYYAAASYIDHLVGMLINRLDELGLRDNTVIVLWGDHGWHLGDHDLWCKHSNFEQATRVPMIFSYPDPPHKGAVAKAPVEFTDIAPTLCELAGVEIPIFFEGESLLPFFANPDTSIRETAMSQYPRWGGIEGYSLRDMRFRYTKWMYDDGTMHSQELYDYTTDPHETRSVHNDASYETTREHLDSILMERIPVPSTQTRIGLIVKGINLNGDTVVLSGSDVYLRDHKENTDASGNVIFTHYPGAYDFSVEARGYTPHSGQLEISGDTVIPVFLVQESYEVTFSLVRGWNDQWMEGASVSFGTFSGVTDTVGSVTFNQVPYDYYSILVAFLDDKEQIFEPVAIYSDTTIRLALEQPVYDIEIWVLNRFSMQPVQVAEVTLNGVMKQTDYQGRVTFSEISGTFHLEISKAAYHTMQRSLSIPGEAVREFYLEPTHSTVRVWVEQSGNPVKDALVTVGDSLLTTGALGLAKFDLPNQTFYNYRVSREGMEACSGDFYLYSDTSMTIEMIPLILEQHVSHIPLKIYPNPVVDRIHMTLSIHTEPVGMKILDVFGSVLLQWNMVNTDDFSIDISSLVPGVYYIEVLSGKERQYAKFIKSN